MLKLNKNKFIACIAVGAIFVALYSWSQYYKERGNILIGKLILHGGEAVSKFGIWKNGEKISLGQNSIHGIFDSFKVSTCMFDPGTNGFGNSYPISLTLKCGIYSDTDLLFYETNKHILTIDIYNGIIEDPKFLSTELTDASQIKFIENLLFK